MSPPPKTCSQLPPCSMIRFQNRLNGIGLYKFLAEYPTVGYKGRAFRDFNEKQCAVLGFGDPYDISIDRVGNERTLLDAKEVLADRC